MHNILIDNIQLYSRQHICLISIVHLGICTHFTSDDNDRSWKEVVDHLNHILNECVVTIFQPNKSVPGFVIS